MAVDKFVDSAQLDSDLTSIADTIREKSGVNDTLSFPLGFMSAINNMPSAGITDEIAMALLACLEKVSWVDEHGYDYYVNLFETLYPDSEIIINKLIGCNNSNSLKKIDTGDSYNATITVESGYTLTGATVSITMGGTDITSSAYNNGTISIASVTGDLIIMISATVNPYSDYVCYYDFTESLTDKAEHTVLTLVHGNDANADAQRTSSGLVFSQASQVAHFGQIDPVGKTFEFTIDSFTFSGDTTKHIRILQCSNDVNGMGPLIYRANTGWSAYSFWKADLSDISKAWGNSPWSGMQGSGSSVINMINGKTVKIVFESSHSVALYLDNVLKSRMTDLYYESAPGAQPGDNQRYNKSISFGGVIDTPSGAEGDQCYTLTLRNFKIYNNS